jgi:hypothetical protein
MVFLAISAEASAFAIASLAISAEASAFAAH